MRPLPDEDLRHVLRHLDRIWEALRGESVFITGGSGFVGSWLVETLLFANDSLQLHVAATIVTRNAQNFRKRFPRLAFHPNVNVLEGSLSELTFPSGRFGYVIHAATEQSSVPTSQNPMGTFDADVAITRRVLEFSLKCGARRILFTSSGAVYGEQPTDMPNVPEHYAGAPLTTDPGSVYGQAKRASEFICTMYHHAYGLNISIARLFAFVGPRLPLGAQYAIGNFIRDSLQGEPITVLGDGTPYRSYLYAADLAIWLWKIVISGSTLRVFNVGSPHGITIADLARTVGAGAEVCIKKRPDPAEAPRRYVPSTDRAENELGLRPWISLSEGIARTMRYEKETLIE